MFTLPNLFIRVLYLAHIFLCISTAGIADATTHLCSHQPKSLQYPANGTWMKMPPYWKPQQCRPHAFDVDATKQCLQNRTIYVVGISTARQVAYSILTAVGGTTVSRQDQKVHCPMNDQAWGETCQLAFQGLLKIKFLFLHFMDGFNYDKKGGFTFVKGAAAVPPRKVYNNANEVLGNYSEPLMYPSDSCVLKDSMESCLSNFFNGSSENDVLVFNLGRSYSIASEVVDTKAWVRQSAQVWRKAVTSTFPGKVFQVMPAQTHRDWEYRNVYTKALNDVLWEEWGGNYQETRQWVTIDQWAINEGRERLYNDRIHFAGPLTDASVQIMLNHLCPLFGNVIDFPKHLPTQHRLSNRIFLIDNSTNYVFVDDGLQTHQFTMPYSSEKSCFQYFQLHNKNWTQNSFIRFGGSLSSDILATLEIGSEMDDKLCQDRSLVRVFNERSVYVMLNGKLESIHTFKESYDPNSVQVVTPWQMEILKLHTELP